MTVFHVALLEVVRGADVVVRTDQQHGAFAFEKLSKRGDLVGRCVLVGRDMIEAEDQQGVGIGQNAFVDRKPYAGLVDTLIARDRRSACLAG